MYLSSPSSLSALSMELTVSSSSSSSSSFTPWPVLSSLNQLPFSRAYASARSMSMPMTHLAIQSRLVKRRRSPPRTMRVSCEVALKSEPKVAPVISAPPSQLGKDPGQGPEDAVIGAKVRVKVPVKVYHVPRVPEVELIGMEGTVKQDVGVFRGTQISASLPFKVEFVKEIKGGNRSSPVKFSVHLKEDEFDYV